MTTVDLVTPGRVLAIGAHPDDIEFGCGATIAKWSKAGAHVELLILTDGSKGSWDPDTDPRELVATRAAEQEEAASTLGAAHSTHLGAVDGELAQTPAVRDTISAIIREVRPDVVIGHDPWKPYRLHPDHRHAGFLTVDALVAAREPHFFVETGAPPHRPERLLLFEAAEPDHVERIDTTLEIKIDALLRHRSQWRSTLGIDPDEDVEEAVEAFRERIRTAAIADGALGGVALGEAFTLLEDL
jgi:LmbE family N-acetylglucosaminyl deacetylase